MSTSNPINPQQQQELPPVQTTQQAYTARSGRGAVGPVIGVLALITVLGAIAVMIGRLCSGRRVMGHVQYDFEGWVETKCASCIDGRVVEPPPPRSVVEHRLSGEAAGAAPRPQERGEESRGEGVAGKQSGERS